MDIPVETSKVDSNPGKLGSAALKLSQASNRSCKGLGHQIAEWTKTPSQFARSFSAFQRLKPNR